MASLHNQFMLVASISNHQGGAAWEIPLTGPASKIFTLPTEYFPAYAAKKDTFLKHVPVNPTPNHFLTS